MNKPIKYLITSISLLAIVLLIASIRGIFTETESYKIIHILSDSFFVPSVILMSIAILGYIKDQGTFDMLFYGTLTFFSLFRRDVNDRKYKTYLEYKESKRALEKPDRRHIFIPSLAGILIAVIFLVIYFQITP